MGLDAETPLEYKTTL